MIDSTLKEIGFKITLQTFDGGQLRFEEWRNKSGDIIIWNGRWNFKPVCGTKKTFDCIEDLKKSLKGATE